MIYSTVSARFMAQLNMSFMQYLLFWNCRYIAWYWKPTINSLWHNKWRCGRRFDPSESWYFPHMHQFLIHQGTVPSNVYMTCSRESTAQPDIFYKATMVPRGVEVGVDCLTLSPRQPEWNSFGLVAKLTWIAGVFLFVCFVPTQHPCAL